MSDQPFNLARLDDAHRRIGAMCKNGHPPKMSIPARPEHDDDLVICKTLEDAGKEITSLRSQLAASREREGRLALLVKHAWIYSGYRDCGRDQMTTEQRALYDQIANTGIEELQALSPPSDGGVGGWLPIETAPRDGTPILGCSYSSSYVPVYAIWCSYHPNAKGKECWRNDSMCGDKLDGLTHWQPLPPPPTQASATSSEGGEG